MVCTRTWLICAALGVATVTGLGCKKEPLEPAPVTGQEFLEYRIETSDAATYGKVFIRVEGDGFVLSTDNAEVWPPQSVNAELANGRRDLKLFNLGWLWLKPSARRVGAVIPVGTVLEQKVWNQVPVFVAGNTERRDVHWYFHTETGFLVDSQTSIQNHPHRAILVGTNIVGLPLMSLSGK